VSSRCRYININNALSYYYLADGGCVKDGPHFSATYFTTINGVVGAIAGMAGVSIFYGQFSFLFSPFSLTFFLSFS
jgi:hypothetical protein